MIEVERFILIGCLLQGALGRQWAVLMPQSIEALSESCVLIPCRFEMPTEHDDNLVAGAKGLWKKRSATKGETVFDSSKNETTPEKNTINGKLIGDLLMKNCTTILDRFPSSYSDTYFFRLESQVLYSFGKGVRINAQSSPPKPKLTPEKILVTEGARVSLSCSAAAPCPKRPPNLTWTPRLGDSVDQLQDNKDQTKSVSSVLTFTASHFHHGQNITCRALYTLQQGDIQKASEASLTLSVLYMPQISGSGSCSRTAAEISCSCESRGNPSPSMEWRVSGLRVTNSTDRVIREEQLGNTGLRSSLTMRQSQGDTPTVLCISTNTVGNSSLQLHVPYMPQISGSGSCSRTAAEISCSCESRGNPSPSIEWRVSGLRVTNSTDRVIREEQLGNTGLRSSLTMRQSQGDTPTVLCISINTLGNSSLQLHVPCPQCSDFSTSSLLIGAAAGAGVAAGVVSGVVAGAVITYCIMKSSQMQGVKRGSQHSGSRSKDTEGSPSPAEEDPVYGKHTMATTQSTDTQLKGAEPQTQSLGEDRNREGLEDMHYASIKHSPRPVETQGQDACEGGVAGHGADVIYSEVQLKRKPKKGKAEGGEG